MTNLSKHIFFLILMTSLISLTSCDKHILKKLRNLNKKPVSTATDAVTSNNDQLTPNAGGDLTGIPNQKNKTYMVAALKRTPCLGSCSTYEAKLYSDGSATFYGRKNVNLKGRYEGQISAEQMKSLIEKINESDFFNLKSEYGNDDEKRVSETSKTITTIQLGNQSKKIKTNEEGPEALLALQNYLDELFDRMDWVAR